MTELPWYAESAINLLEQEGFKAYIVGGCVRDILMQRSPSDFDITTSALPHEIMNVFKNCSVIPTGLKHGTVTVILDNRPIEITTFRQEGEYLDSRRPESVHFVTDIKDDLSRRDFTVNAMAYNHKEGLIDFFEGQQDIHNRIIRCVGEPSKRFNEDALRILRGLRFASVLDFDIEERTNQAIMQCVSKLINISSERKNTELSKLIMGKGFERVARQWGEILFASTGIPLPDKTRISAIAHSPLDLYVRLSLLFSNGQEAHDSLGKLKYDNKTVKTVSEISEKLMQTETDTFNVKQMLKDMGNGYFLLLDARNALEKVTGQARMSDMSRQLAQEISAGNQCISLKQLAITGRDLTPFAQGPEIGKILETLLNEVMADKLQNTSQTLLSRAAELLENK